MIIVSGLKCSNALKNAISKIFSARNKRNILFGYYSNELERMSRLKRIEAEIATNYKRRELERFMVKSGRVVLLGADNLSFTDKEFRICDRRICMVDRNGKVKKKTQVARSLLALKVGSVAKEITWHSDEMSAGAFNYAPFYYRKGEYENAVMIDLRRAHYSIYSRLTWDLRLLFQGEKFVGYRNGKVKLDFDANLDKVILQRIYGAFASRQITIWDGIETETRISFDETKGYKNIYYSPTLVFALMQTLHHIAVKAVKCGAIYIYTDGYMFQKGKEKQFLDYLDKLSLAFKVEKVGAAKVFGYNAYEIGGLKVGLERAMTRLQNEELNHRRKTSAYREIMKEIFGSFDYQSGNLDFSAVNFLTGKNLVGKNFNFENK